MTDQHTIALRRCRTVDDAISIRRNYRQVAPGVETLVVDLGMLDRHIPEALLLGVLLNMRKFFAIEVEILLRHYPIYLPRILQVCRKESLFTLYRECE